MEKIKIKIGIIGYLPFSFNQKKIEKWKSKLFSITEIAQYNINSQKSDSGSWEYSDAILSQELPPRQDEDIFIGITYVPIECNYFSRRLDNNRIIISYFDIHQVISQNNIPIENLLLRIVYASSIVYLCEKNIPTTKTMEIEFLHDDTRGCIYDMDGNKYDIIYSLDQPKLCNSCIEKLRKKKITEELIQSAINELKNIKKDPYWQIANFIKKRPLISISLTFIFGVIMSIVANYLYDFIETW